MITDAGGPPHVLQLLQTSRVLKSVPVMSQWQTVFMDASFTTPTITISSFSQCLFWLNKSFISGPAVPSGEVQSLHVGLRNILQHSALDFFFRVPQYHKHTKRVPLLQHKTLSVECINNNTYFEDTGLPGRFGTETSNFAVVIFLI
jgi:hypothetical protein